MEGISPGRGEFKKKSLRIPSASEPTLYYISSQPGPSPSTSHWSWPSLTLDIAYYFNNMTLNIRCRKSRPISATTWRVSEKCQSGVWIGGYGVQKGLRATFRGGGGLIAIFRGGVGWGVGVEEACSSVGDCWKGLGIRSTLKHLQNAEAVRVQRMPKVSKVRVGKTLRCFQSRKQVIPWQQSSSILAYIASNFLVLPISPSITIHIYYIFTQDLYFIIQRNTASDTVPSNPSYMSL